jgi:hypothetical protein
LGGYFISGLVALFLSKYVGNSQTPEDASITRIFCGLFANLAAITNAPILFINRRVDF